MNNMNIIEILNFLIRLLDDTHIDDLYHQIIMTQHWKSL